MDAAAVGSTETRALQKIKTAASANKDVHAPANVSGSRGEELKQVLSSYLQLPTLAELEETVISEAMKRADGNMSQAAKLLGIHRQTIAKKLQQTPPGK